MNPPESSSESSPPTSTLPLPPSSPQIRADVEGAEAQRVGLTPCVLRNGSRIPADETNSFGLV